MLVRARVGGCGMGVCVGGACVWAWRVCVCAHRHPHQGLVFVQHEVVLLRQLLALVVVVVVAEAHVGRADGVGDDGGVVILSQGGGVWVGRRGVWVG